uniref:hypothetical protein n=1 Tax=Rheinheimera sp. TaxID=1869214 RepID=UPI0040477428
MPNLTNTEIVPIFSGGGTRLSCYIGILQALLDMGFIFRHLVGCLAVVLWLPYTLLAGV